MPLPANNDDILLEAITKALSHTASIAPDEVALKKLRGSINTLVKTCLRLTHHDGSNSVPPEDGGYAAAAMLLEKLLKGLRKVRVQHLETCLVLIPVYADCIRILPFTLLPSPPSFSLIKPLKSPTRIVQHILNSIICLSSAHPSLSSIAKHALHQIGTYISKFLQNLESIQMELVHSSVLKSIVRFCNLTCQLFDDPKTNSLSVFTLTNMSVEKLFHWVRTGQSLQNLLMTRFLLPLLEHAVIASENWDLASQLILRLYDRRTKSEPGLSEWLISCASSQRFSHARHFFDPDGSTPDESTLLSIHAFLNLRLFSVRVLGEFPSNHTQITLTLLALLDDSSHEIRDFAARTLSQRSIAGDHLEEQSDSRKTRGGCLAAVHVIRMNTSPSVGCYLRDETGSLSDTPYRDVRWERVRFSNPYKCLLKVLQDRWMNRDRYRNGSLRENESFGLWAKYISYHVWTCPIHLQHPRWKNICRKLVGTLAKGLLLCVLECDWKNEISDWLCVASIVGAVLESSCFEPSYPSCDDKVLKVFQPLLKRMRASENEQAQKACVDICGKLVGTSGDAFLDPKEPLHYGALSTLYSILRVGSPLNGHDYALRLRVQNKLQTTYPTESSIQSQPIKLTPSKRTRSPIRANATTTGIYKGRLGAKANSVERSEGQRSVGTDCDFVGRNIQRNVRRRTDRFQDSNRKRAVEEKENELIRNLNSEKSTDVSLPLPLTVLVDRATCTRLDGNHVSSSEIRRKKYFGRDFSPVKNVCFSDVDDDGGPHVIADSVSSNSGGASDTFPPPHERFTESGNQSQEASVVAANSFGCTSDTFPPPHERFDEIHASRQLAHKSKHDNTSHQIIKQQFSDKSTTSLVLESTMTSLQQPQQESITEYSFIDDHFDPLAGIQPSLNTIQSERAVPQIRKRSAQSKSTRITLPPKKRDIMRTEILNGNESRGTGAGNSPQASSPSLKFGNGTSESSHCAIPFEPTGCQLTDMDSIAISTSTLKNVIRSNRTGNGRSSRRPKNVVGSRSVESTSPLDENGEMDQPEIQIDRNFGSSRPDGRPVVYDHGDLVGITDIKYPVVPKRLAGAGNCTEVTSDEDGRSSTRIDAVREVMRWTGYEGGTHRRDEVRPDGMFAPFVAKGIPPDVQRENESESEEILPKLNSVAPCENQKLPNADHTSVLPTLSFSLSLQSLQSNGRRSVPPSLIRDRVQIGIRKLLKILKTRQRSPFEMHPLLFQVFGVEPGLLVDACSDILNMEATAGNEPWLEHLETISRRLVPLSRILRILEKQLRAPISLAQALIIVRDQISLRAFSAGSG